MEPKASKCDQRRSSDGDPQLISYFRAHGLLPRCVVSRRHRSECVPERAALGWRVNAQQRSKQPRIVSKSNVVPALGPWLFQPAPSRRQGSGSAAAATARRCARVRHLVNPRPGRPPSGTDPEDRRQQLIRGAAGPRALPKVPTGLAVGEFASASISHHVARCANGTFSCRNRAPDGSWCFAPPLAACQRNPRSLPTTSTVPTASSFSRRSTRSTSMWQRPTRWFATRTAKATSKPRARRR